VRLRFDDETEAFRAEFVEWLEQNRPTHEEQDELSLSSAHLPPWARAWQRRLFDSGWLVPGWPPDLGGRDATPVQQMVYFEEIARRSVARSFNPQGLSIITPSIIDWGTPEQRERFAVPTLKGEITWCLGMSEPGAGSDLASLSTRAELQGDRFVINGQKVWTSGAHHADFCFCFVRTDPDAPKHRGISVVIVDMKTPGITIRPLADLTSPDSADFNEVFFSDVVAPAENLLGELHRGWSIAGGSLAHERGMLWVQQATRLDRSVRGLCELADEDLGGGRRLADDPIFRDRLATAYIDSQALMYMGYRGFAKFAKGMTSPEHSILKLFGSEVERRMAREINDALAPDSLDLEQWVTALGNRGVEPWPIRYLRSFSNTIAGGTSEIQRNIIAERVLGLPRG
jgi:alkylation response protein AidB-like acyl-CoA dehydrogenase